jgi:hypothetical protein
MAKNDIHAVILFFGQCLKEKGIADPKVCCLGHGARGEEVKRVILI